MMCGSIIFNVMQIIYKSFEFYPRLYQLKNESKS